MGCRGNRLKILIAAALAGGMGVQGEVVPFGGDPVRPGGDSPVEVVSASLTIRLGQVPSPPPEAVDRSLGGQPVHVHAEYRLRNPTDAGQRLALALPLLGDRLVYEEKSGGVITMAQDGKPVDMTITYPEVGLAENDEARQRAWMKRLDEWVAHKPDLAALLQKHHAAALLVRDGDARHKLEEALARHFSEWTVAGAAAKILLAPDEPGSFGSVITLLPRTDRAFRIVDAKGNEIPILQDDPRLYLAHREEWTKKVLAWLNDIADIRPALAAARAEQAGYRALRDLEDQIAKLAQGKYDLSDDTSRMLLWSSNMRAPGDPAVLEKDPFNPGPDAQGKTHMVMPVYVSAALAAAFSPEAAAETAAETKLQSDYLVAWGGDWRHMSLFTGKLYLPKEPDSSDRLEEWLGEKDASARIPAGELPRYSDDKGFLFGLMPQLATSTLTLAPKAQSTLILDYTLEHENRDRGPGSNCPMDLNHFTFNLETCKYWKSFGPLTVTISAPDNIYMITTPPMDKSAVVAGRREVSATFAHISGNLHIATLPTDGGVNPNFDREHLEATLAQFQKLLAAHPDKQIRPVIQAAITNLLHYLNRNYEAWALAMVARQEAPDAPFSSGVYAAEYQPNLPEQVWNFIESKAKSPAMRMLEKRDIDPATGVDSVVTPQETLPDFSASDLEHLAERIGAWDASRGTPMEDLGAAYLLCVAGRDRARNQQKIVDVGLAQEDCAATALTMLSMLPGDNSAGWPLIIKYLPEKFPDNATPLQEAAKAGLINLHSRATEIIALAQRTTDPRVLFACIDALRQIPDLPANSFTDLLALEESMSKFTDESKFNGSYSSYLQLLARNNDRGLLALRDLLKKRPTVSLAIGEVLAEKGDMSALDTALQWYKTGLVPKDTWSDEYRQMGHAVHIIALSKAPGIFKRIVYRPDIDQNGHLLQLVSDHADPDAWPFAEAYYNQHVKRKKDLQDREFVWMLVKTGDPRAAAMLREMAPHGDMGYVCARAIGDLLYPPGAKPAP